MQNNTSDVPPLIQSTLNLLETNLNNSFAAGVSDILQQSGVNMNNLWKPSVDILDSDQYLIIYMNVPGVDSNNLDVDFFNNNVIIRGNRNFPNTENIVIINRRQEIVYGNFERKLTIPFSVTRRESVSIDLKNGVLSIKIDKRIETQNSFTININDSSSQL
tara:strand:- start:31818 stop:32300 length:483 start_codon:yes stop_codon:yes gene_type:complete